MYVVVLCAHLSKANGSPLRDWRRLELLGELGREHATLKMILHRNSECLCDRGKRMIDGSDKKTRWNTNRAKRTSNGDIPR